MPQVAYATGKGLSQRRACTLLGVGRSALHYRSTKLAKDAPVLARMAELSAQYPRYGYRRIAIFLGRDGHRDELRPGAPAVAAGAACRCRASGQESASRPAAHARKRRRAPNQVWSYDFVFDWCANGQQLKCLTVTDELTKEGLGDRGRRPHPLRPRDRGVVAPGERARRTDGILRSRQWAGVRVPALADVDRRPRHRHGIDRSGQALAEWRRRRASTASSATSV